MLPDEKAALLIGDMKLGRGERLFVLPSGIAIGKSYFHSATPKKLG